MNDILERISTDLAKTESLEEYQAKVSEYARILSEEGYGDIAVHIREMSDIKENRFSKRSTKENLEYNKKSLLKYLSEISDRMWSVSSGQAVKLVGVILDNFHTYCRQLYKEPIHGKCSSSLKAHLPGIKIENEYDLQRLLYPIICTVFREARIEENEDSGHHTVRKDIVLDEQDIAIELKCSRNSMTERQLSDEVAADIVHYSNRYIFFYIYDRENVIKNAQNFIRTYEEKRIENKEIHVFLWQSNAI